MIDNIFQTSISTIGFELRSVAVNIVEVLRQRAFRSTDRSFKQSATFDSTRSEWWADSQLPILREQAMDTKFRSADRSLK